MKRLAASRILETPAPCGYKARRAGTASFRATPGPGRNAAAVLERRGAASCRGTTAPQAWEGQDDEGIGGRAGKRQIHDSERKDRTRTRARLRSLPGWVAVVEPAPRGGGTAGRGPRRAPGRHPRRRDPRRSDHAGGRPRRNGASSASRPTAGDCSRRSTPSSSKRSTRGSASSTGCTDAASDDAEIAAAAKARGVELIDLRKPKPKHELHFWEGDVYRVPRAAPRGARHRLRARASAPPPASSSRR